MPDNTHAEKSWTESLAHKPSIAVYGIYKNEEKFIERFLNSVQTADEIVLCDTGSNDKTNQIINQFKEAHPQVNIKVYSICVSPWRFDDARNTALSLVNPEIDICISLDIDEYLMDGWREHFLDQWEAGYTGYYHKTRNIRSEGNVSEHWHQRIHTRTGYTWKLPVCEILEYKGQEKVKKLPDFLVFHESDPDKSRTNYLSLLEQSVKERGDFWRSWSLLADEYLMAGRHEESLKAINTALDLKDGDKAFLYKQKYFVYRAQDQTELALINLNNALSHLPYRRELYFEKAIYLHQLGRNLEAYFSLKESEKFTNKISDHHYNPEAWDAVFEDWRSKILELAKKEGISVE